MLRVVSDHYTIGPRKDCEKDKNSHYTRNIYGQVYAEVVFFQL